MSENRSRFRMKKGDIEIEYEGESAEVTARYQEAFEWIKTVAVPPPKPAPPKEKEKVKEKEPEKKPDKRGGLRTAVVSKEIDKLSEEGWLDDFKKVEEVRAELERRAVRGAYRRAVDTVLRRRVGKTLERVKDTDRKWVYRKKRD